MNTSISTSSDSRQMPNIRNLGRAIGSGTARRGPGGHDGSVISNNTFKAVTTGPPAPSMSVWALAILAGLLLLTFNGRIRREIWRVSPSRG